MAERKRETPTQFVKEKITRKIVPLLSDLGKKKS